MIGEEFSSEDDTVVWKHAGDVIQNDDVPYKLCRSIDAVGKTKLLYFDNEEQENTFQRRQERDYTNASIFPGNSTGSMAGVADDILSAIGSVPAGYRRGIFQVALNLLETPWCSIQLVALEAPQHPGDVVSVPCASAGDMDTVGVLVATYSFQKSIINPWKFSGSRPPTGTLGPPHCRHVQEIRKVG